MFHRGGQFPGYTIREVLEAPRMYEHYVATNDRGRKWCMIRTLSVELSASSELRAYYESSCRAFSQYFLDGVMPIRGLGMTPSHRVFAVYPYDWSSMSFGELAYCIQSHHLNFSLSLPASLLLDAARILCRAYHAGLYHFCVTPECLLMTQFGDTIVHGFVEAQMRRRFRFGTDLNEKFDAPEWRSRGQVGVESDVYAIGSILFQSITNEYQPDEWEPRWRLMGDLLTRAQITGVALQTLIRFFQTALAEQPERRYRTYEQLISALEEVTHVLGGYLTREDRASIFSNYFDPYPPEESFLDPITTTSDVIELISSNSAAESLEALSARASASPIDMKNALSGFGERVRVDLTSGVDSCLKHSTGGSGNLSFEDTLSSPSQAGFETRVVRRLTGNYRTMNPALRASVQVSPIEVLARSRYQILNELGSGGTGTVYKVLDTTLSDVLALKVLRPEFVSDSTWLARFKSELKITRDLEHPYILQAYHLEQMEGLYFYTMRYIDGKNLSELLRDAPLPLMLSLRILTQICEALVAAHDRGIIHRDIKPANIMVENGTFHPYLMDFGIAGTLDMPASGIAGQGIGTPYYMAPEQSRGEVITVQSDIYAFGVVCYECFTRKLPFVGDTPLSIYTARMSGVFEPIKSLNPIVPAMIASMVESCLAPNPEDRPASMRVVLDGLGRMM